MEIDLKELGSRFREIRKYLGFTQEAVAQDLNLNQASVARLEKGSDLGSHKLMLFLKYYSKYISIDILFGEHYNLCKAEDEFIKNVHLSSIVTERLKIAKEKFNTNIQKCQDDMNKELLLLIHASDENK